MNNQNFLDFFPTKSIFLLYLIIGANFLAETYNCKIQHLCRNNMLVKHIIGFMTLFIFVVGSDTDENIWKKIIKGLVAYTIFFLTTKMNHKIWFICILLFFIIYVIDGSKDKEKSDEKKKNLDKAIVGLSYIIFILIIIGVILYIGEKKYEYRNNFDLYKFLLGNPNCKNDGLQGLPSKSEIEYFKELILT